MNLLVTIPWEHKVLMADHKSLVVPSREYCPVFEDKNKAIIDARQVETQIVQKLPFDDVHIVLHPDLSDRQDPPEGYTFGFGVGDDDLCDPDDDEDEPFTKPKNLRRIDRLHVTVALKDCPVSTYTAFVARADHKAVHVTCQPPNFDDPPPPPRDLGAMKSFLKMRTVWHVS